MPQNESDLYPYSVADLSPKDALIIAPHPDDESLGCGGSIVKHIKAGNRVKVIFLTDGDKGDFEGRFGKNYTRIRRQSAHEAMEILGVQDYEFWGYEDRNLYSAEKEVEDKLRHTIERFSPSLIYVPSPFEAHPDHRVTASIGWRIHNETNISVAFCELLMPVYPNILVDISEELNTKEAAIQCYRTELYYNDYAGIIKGLNRFRTATLPATIKYAEAFILYQNSSHFADTLSLKLLPIALAGIRD